MSGPGIEVSIKPEALAADWAWRTSVNVMVRGPVACAEAQPAASTETATTATKRRRVSTISPDSREQSKARGSLLGTRRAQLIVDPTSWRDEVGIRPAAHAGVAGDDGRLGVR